MTRKLAAMPDLKNVRRIPVFMESDDQFQKIWNKDFIFFKM